MYGISLSQQNLSNLTATTHTPTTNKTMRPPRAHNHSPPPSTFALETIRFTAVFLSPSGRSLTLPPAFPTMSSSNTSLVEWVEEAEDTTSCQESTEIADIVVWCLVRFGKGSTDLSEPSWKQCKEK